VSFPHVHELGKKKGCSPKQMQGRLSRNIVYTCEIEQRPCQSALSWSQHYLVRT